MLLTFPDIVYLAPFTIFFFRLAIASTLAYSSWQHFVSRADGTSRILGVVEALATIAIAGGAWTQIGGIAASLILIAELALPRLRVVTLGTVLLALVIAASLIVTGPGILSFDLPL